LTSTGRPGLADKHELAVDLATAVMTVEQVPDIAMLRKNAAALVHDLDAGCPASVDGDRKSVCVRVLSNGGAPDRYKQLAVGQLTDMIATAAGDATLVPRGGPAGRGAGILRGSRRAARVRWRCGRRRRR